MSAAASAIAWAERYWETTSSMIDGRAQLRDWSDTVERARARLRSTEQARIARGWPLDRWARTPSREAAAQNAVAATLALGERVGEDGPRLARAAIRRYARLDESLLELDWPGSNQFRYEPEYVERASCFVSTGREGILSVGVLAAHHVEPARQEPSASTFEL